MTDLRAAVTALLDTPGVHPWDGWQEAYNKCFDLFKETTVEGAIHGTLDQIQAEHGHKDHVDIDDAVRLNAHARFWAAFNDSRVPAARKKRNGGTIKQNLVTLAGIGPKNKEGDA